MFRATPAGARFLFVFGSNDRMAMQVICTDGTVFACEGYELTEYGAVIYGQEFGEDSERYDSDPEQTGYVPHDRLRYILPDGVEPKLPGLATARGQPGQQVPPRNRRSPPGQSPSWVGQSQQNVGRQQRPPSQHGLGQR